MIRKLNLSNFKSWSNTGDIKFSPLTGFFGTNSSGKTSILQLLLLLKQTTESADRSQPLDFGNEKSYLELGTFNDVIYNHDPGKSLALEIDWQLEKPLRIEVPEKNGDSRLFQDTRLGFKTSLKQTSQARQEGLFVEYLSYDFDHFSYRMQKSKGKSFWKLSTHPMDDADARGFEVTRTRGRAWDLPSPIKCYGFPDQVKAYYQNAGFLSDFQLKFEQLFSRIYYLGPLREYPKRQYTWAGAQPSDMGRRGERAIDAMLASRQKGKKISRGKGKKKLSVEEYVAHWLKELKLIHDFRVEPIVEGGNLYQVKASLSPGSPEVLITDVGFGVSQILPVITLCYYVPDGSTLIIEQPEIHLHPKAQAGLADVFIDAIEKKNIQIILESHSEHLLRRLQRRIAEQEFESSNAALYFCEPQNGSSCLRKLDIDSYGNVINWPENFFGDEMGELAAMSEAIYNRKKNE